mmetsp:Transcript_17535/g.42796  ORF Transcript_17535/g.42796 Transcript_17535/m.42796 type:complete len:324 (+) Transcript_17535:62-1033(+)
MGWFYSLFPFFAAKHNEAMLQKRLGPSKLYDNYFMNKDGLWIYTTKWGPKGTPKGVIFILHGMGEYIHRYDAAAALLNEEGYLVFGMDHQGHGRSEGERLHVEKFTDYVDDVIQLVKTSLDKDPSLKKLPRFLMGHSFGGCVAIYTGLASAKADLAWSGMILSAPALFVDPKVASPVMLKLLGVLSYALPRLALPWEKGAVALGPLSHDEVVCAHYHSDPLVYHGGMRPRFSAEVIGAIGDAQVRKAEFKIPYIIIHGSSDFQVPLIGSQEWHAGTSSTDKTLKIIDGSYHEMLNEVPQYRDQFVKEMKEWLASHNKPPAVNV